jgi:hypothetical protein
MGNEIITLGALSVHFLIEAADSNGTRQPGGRHE